MSVSAARPDPAGVLSSPASSVARAWVWALALVALWYGAAQGGIAYFFGVSPGSGAWLRDLGAHLLLGGVLFLMARGVMRFALAMVVLFSAFTLGNAMKLAVLGGPVMPDDFVAARNLFLLLDGWQFWASVAMLAVPALALLWMFAWRMPRAWVAPTILRASSTSPNSGACCRRERLRAASCTRWMGKPRIS